MFSMAGWFNVMEIKNYLVFYGKYKIIYHTTIYTFIIKIPYQL